MFPPVNLSPVEELLTDVVLPERLAQILDNIYFDYVYAMFSVLLIPNQKDFMLNDGVLNYIWYLRKLRDVFRACEIK